MILATRYVVRAYRSQSILSSPHSATCAWYVFNTFTTSSNGVYGIRVVNMIYGPSRWPGGKSGLSTGQDTSHFTPPMPRQVLCRQPPQSFFLFCISFSFKHTLLFATQISRLSSYLVLVCFSSVAQNII